MTRLRVAAGLHLLSCVGLFCIYHLLSVADAPNAMFDAVPAYLDWIVSHPRLGAARLAPAGGAHALLYAVALCLAAGTYLFLLAAVRRAGARLGRLVLLALVCAAPLALAPTVQSRDAYVYTMLGRMQVQYGVNPYLHRVGSFPEDPLMQRNLLIFHDEVAPYGQVVMIVLRIHGHVARALGGGVGTSLALFKLLGVALHLFAGWLIWRLLTVTGRADPALGAAAYLANPLCLIEFANSAHNDGLGICLLLGGLLLHVSGRRLLAGVAIALAVLSKVYILPVACLYGIGLAREGTWRDAARFVGVGVVVGAALVWPYWDGPASLTTFLRGNHMHKGVNSMGALVQAMTLDAFILPREPADQLLQPDTVRELVTWGGLLLVGVTCLVGAWWTDRTSRVAQAGGWYAFIGVTLGSGWFWPWYTILPLALALVSGAPRLRRAAIALTLCAPLLYAIIALGGPRSPHPYGQELYYYKPLFVFVPALVLAAWAGLGAVRNR